MDIKNNDLFSNTEGIYETNAVQGSNDGSLIMNNQIYENTNGLNLNSVNTNSSIRDNDIYSNSKGIYIRNGAWPSITGNTISLNTEGIFVSSASPFIKNNDTSEAQRGSPSRRVCRVKWIFLQYIFMS